MDTGDALDAIWKFTREATTDDELFDARWTSAWLSACLSGRASSVYYSEEVLEHNVDHINVPGTRNYYAKGSPVVRLIYFNPLVSHSLEKLLVMTKKLALTHDSASDKALTKSVIAKISPKSTA